MRAIATIAALAGMFGLGALLGPLAAIAIASLGTPDNERQIMAAALRLMTAFDDRYPAEPSLYSIEFDGDVTDCGYDVDLVGQAEPFDPFGQTWTPYTGYFDLTHWRSDDWRREAERRRVEFVARQLSPFELTFLSRCIGETAFADLCGEKVRNLLDSGNRLRSDSMPADEPRYEQPRQNRTICTYLDGLAARRGQPLSAGRRDTAR